MKRRTRWPSTFARPNSSPLWPTSSADSGTRSGETRCSSGSSFATKSTWKGRRGIVNDSEDGDARRSTAALATNGVFLALVLGAAVLALSSFVKSPSTNDRWPLVGSPTQHHREALDVSTGLAYQQRAVSFEGDRAARLGPQALNGIDYPWGTELRGWTITFMDGEGHVAGYTWSQESRIEVFVRPGDDANTVRRVLAHELGHAVDVSLNDTDDRTRWLEVRGASTATWWPTSGAADFETGAGDFAEVFAAWQTDNDDFRSRVAGPPTQEDFALLRSLAFD
mgnify:CR=1 FL=1